MKDRNRSKKKLKIFWDYFFDGLRKRSEINYEGAINAFTKAIEIDPHFSDSYLKRGIAKFKLEKYADAIDDCNKAIEIREIPKYYLYRGQDSS